VVKAPIGASRAFPKPRATGCHPQKPERSAPLTLSAARSE
jgi:hypothetical protein